MAYESVWQEESVTRAEVEAFPGFVLVEFGADWCPHCQAVQPLLERLLSGREVRHIKVADGKGKRLGRTFGVKLWPNFVLLRDGEILGQVARPTEGELAELLTNP